jgi:hypothetical protein
MFNGSEDEITEFLEQFENCADDVHLPDNDRVSFLCRYLSRQQRNIFQAFDGYSPSDWPTFKSAIKEEFEGAFREMKYTRQSLIQLARKQSEVLITTDAEL